jgi:hypothetical protein
LTTGREAEWTARQRAGATRNRRIAANWNMRVGQASQCDAAVGD